MNEKIVELLKKKGLEVAEEEAKNVVKAVFEVLPEVILLTENKYDDLLIPVLGILLPKVLEILDGISEEA